MNIWTDAEKKLCIELHNKGVRPEIREGDWYINPCGEQIIATKEVEKKLALLKTPNSIIRAERILLFSWRQAREWLREKGYPFIELAGPTWINNKMRLRMTTPEGLSKDAEGQTDLEAILAAMVQVAEEKNAKSD